MIVVMRIRWFLPVNVVVLHCVRLRGTIGTCSTVSIAPILYCLQPSSCNAIYRGDSSLI